MGTWHGWKFLPILGEYAVNMQEGKLSQEEMERWSWDREMGKAKREIPRELKDIKGYHDDDPASYEILSQVNKLFKMMTQSR